MATEKMTQGEMLYSEVNSNDNFLIWLVEKKESDKKAKAERKRISDEKFKTAMANQPKVNAVIINEEKKYKHNVFGVGYFVCEDEKTITLSFGGTIKQLVKAFVKLETI